MRDKVFTKIVEIVEELAPYKEPEEIYLYSKKILELLKENDNDPN